jgi:Fe-S-cluster containining protein
MGLNFFPELDLFENLKYLLDIYKDWDESFVNIKNSLNIDCPAFCSNCCNTSVENIQSTIFEMLVAALIFYKILIEKQDFENKSSKSFRNFLFNNFSNFSNENSVIISNVKQLLFYDKTFQVCVFYNKNKDNWGCSIYKIRPAICRLFGFSFKKGKNDNLIFSPCKVLQKQGHKRIHISNKDLNNVNLSNIKLSNIKIQAPIYDKFYYQILSLNFNYTSEFYNINQAFKKAFELVCLRFKYKDKKAG